MQDLRSKAASGVRWTVLSTALVMIIEFARVAILARLLTTRDFGLMSMLMVIVLFSQAFVDMGLSNAIVQKKDVTREQMASVFWVNVGCGIVLFLLLVLLSPWIAVFYKEKALGELVVFVAVNLLIIPIGQLSQSLLQKNLKFKALSSIDIQVSVSTFVVSTGLALGGFGVYALIFSLLFSSFLRSVLLLGAVREIWRPFFHFSMQDLCSFYKFGLFQMGEKMVNYLSANTDYLFIGRFLGAEMLGAYTIALQLVVMPFMKLNPVLTKVAFPIFSLKQDDPGALRKGYMELIKMVCLVVFPVSTVIAVTAPVFIPLVYGDKWVMAVGIVQLLALIGFAKAVANPSGSILLAKGRADVGFHWNVFTAVVNTIVFYFAAQRSVFAVALAWSVLALFYNGFSWIILRYVIGLSLKEYYVTICRFLGLCTGIGIVMVLIQKILLDLGLNLLLCFVITVLSGVGTYLALVLFFEKDYIVKIFGMFFDRKGKVCQA